MEKKKPVKDKRPPLNPQQYYDDEDEVLGVPLSVGWKKKVN